MQRRDFLEDGDNHERWLVSYADFITLLFAFFVVMYAISSVNEGKYRILSATLTEAFDSTARSLEPIQVGDPLQSASPHVVDVPDAAGFQDPEVGDTHIEPSTEAVAERLAGFVDQNQLTIQANNDWLEISLDAQFLFPAGRAELSASAETLLNETVAFLAEFDNPVTIEGYTDNVPTASPRYPSNWELSAARASTVARYLQQQGIESERLSAVGYGENHPLETNATPDGRARNRRVAIIVARKGNLPRNLNAGTSDSAFAYVRKPQGPDPEDAVQPIRTEAGGLLFTNDADAETPES